MPRSDKVHAFGVADFFANTKMREVKVQLTPEAEAYVEELTKKYRATAAEIIQAAAEAALAYSYEQAKARPPQRDLEFETFIVEDAMELATSGRIERLDENWSAGEEVRA
jgi:hypothetical protein